MSVSNLCLSAGGSAPVTQPNLGLLSTESGVHRGATQRLLGELLQRLCVHVLSGRPIKVGLGLSCKFGSGVQPSQCPSTSSMR
jgi:hypothetical protein